MKKIYKPLIVIVIGCVVCLFSMLVLFKKNPSRMTVLTVPNEYLLVSNDLDNIKVPLFVNVEDALYMKKEHISKTYLVNSETKESFSVVLNDVKKLNEFSHQDKTFYGYEFDLFLPFFEDNLMIIKNCFLKLVYKNQFEISCEIGSIAKCLDFQEGSLKYSNLKGFTRIINNTRMLSGVLIKLKTSKNVEINDVAAISTKALINEGEIKQLTSGDLEDLNNINDFIKSDDLIVYEDTYLYIPLTYQEISECNCLGFIIKYTEDNNTYTKVIYPFKFFKTSSLPKVLGETFDIT